MICYDSIINYSMWVWFVGVAMGVTYVLEASSKKLAPMYSTTLMHHLLSNSSPFFSVCGFYILLLSFKMIIIVFCVPIQV